MPGFYIRGTISHFQLQSCVIFCSSRLKVHWLKNISGRKGAFVFYLWAAKRLLQGIPISMVLHVLLIHKNTQGFKQLRKTESGTGWGNKEQRWGWKMMSVGEKEGNREVEEGEEGHEVKWKRSDLTAGEYSSLQRSHKGLVQPLNARHACLCAARTHINLTEDYFLCLRCSHTHINCTCLTLWLIGVSTQFATLHQNHDCRESESGNLATCLKQLMYRSRGF